MDGPKLFRLTSKKLDPFMDRVLGEAKLKTLDDIDFFVFHQASGPALELVCRRFQIPEDRCVRLIRNHGNTVAASLGMGLDELLKSKRIKPGHKVMMMGSSAGVALGALVFERC
jgi:3-oxoacyl-[acyl-carrier-protein] synthase-3